MTSWDHVTTNILPKLGPFAAPRLLILAVLDPYWLDFLRQDSGHAAMHWPQPCIRHMSSGAQAETCENGMEAPWAVDCTEHCKTLYQTI